MTFINKYGDLVIAGIIIILVGIIPVTRFVINMLDYINTYGDTGIGLGLVDLWEYLLWVVDGVWFLVLLPLIIPIITTFRYHQEYHVGNTESIRTTIKQAYMRTIVLVLGYSLLMFILALILPTSSQSSNIEQPFIWILFFHINLVAFSVFITTLGLIVMTYVKKYYLAFIGTVLSFIAITFFLVALGGVFEGVFPEPFNSDWLWIYNTIQFDSGMPEYIGTLIAGVLCVISVVVYKQIVKNEE